MLEAFELFERSQTTDVQRKYNKLRDDFNKALNYAFTIYSDNFSIKYETVLNSDVNIDVDSLKFSEYELSINEIIAFCDLMCKNHSHGRCFNYTIKPTIIKSRFVLRLNLYIHFCISENRTNFDKQDLLQNFQEPCGHEKIIE
jgi:hypothetical protein